MIRLYYSNHLENLMEPLCSHLEKGDPFAPRRVIVPNHNLEIWLNLQIAMRKGIAANLVFDRLEPALARIAGPEGAKPII